MNIKGTLTLTQRQEDRQNDIGRTRWYHASINRETDGGMSAIV